MNPDLAEPYIDSLVAMVRGGGLPVPAVLRLWAEAHQQIAVHFGGAAGAQWAGLAAAIAERARTEEEDGGQSVSFPGESPDSESPILGQFAQALAKGGGAGPPFYWMFETTGALRPAVEAYLNHEEMTEPQIAALRAYLRQWIAGPFKGPAIDRLRLAVDALLSRVAISRWLDAAMDEGIDPL